MKRRAGAPLIKQHSGIAMKPLVLFLILTAFFLSIFGGSIGRPISICKSTPPEIILASPPIFLAMIASTNGRDRLRLSDNSER